MTTPDTVTIDGHTYIRGDLTTDHSDSPVRIVVLQRGWVAVGRYDRDGDTVTIHDAKIIRRWGTTKGLGELIDGPLTDTTLDPAGTIEAHALSVVLTIAADADAWTGHL